MAPFVCAEIGVRRYTADVAIVGAGVSGLVAALELVKLGKQVVLLEQDNERNAGGLARWAFGGMALCETKEQSKAGIADSADLLLRDWLNQADFSASELWQRRWAEAYAYNNNRDVYQWLKQQGLSFMPAVNWAERGQYGPGNSVPRYHILWGTGHGLVQRLLQHLQPYQSQLSICYRHRVQQFVYEQGQIRGLTGQLLDEGVEFELRADAVVLASGGINGDLRRARENWPSHWGTAARAEMLSGASPMADGLLHDKVRQIDARISNESDVWHYAAGVAHTNPHFESHGLSLIPCKSALWLDHTGRRIGPEPLITGFDTHELCRAVSVYPHTWQILNWRIACRELAVSGSEHNAAIRDHSLFQLLKGLLLGNKALVQQMLKDCEDFLAADSLSELSSKMQALDASQSSSPSLSPTLLRQSVADWESLLKRPAAQQSDDQLRRIRQLRLWRPDRLRTLAPSPLLDARHGPLIAIRLRLISRKSLGGIQTDLDSRVLRDDGGEISGLYAVGEAAGFGGGGANGRKSLEGTFLSACVLTARAAAKHIGSAQSLF